MFFCKLIKKKNEKNHLKKKKRKWERFFPYLFSLLLCTFSWRYLLRLSALFFPNNMEGSKRTTTHFRHLCNSTKNKPKKKEKKRYHLR